jgi:D-glycero-D-manno-heptose 1,7-bisphosphate phosphatase
MSAPLRPAVFLDRDGVINVDHAYFHRPEHFEFIDGVSDLVAAANPAGYLVVVVTNQAGSGRGYYSEADFHPKSRSWDITEIGQPANFVG